MLGDKVFIKHLANLKPSKLADKRYNDVTIQHLMDHKGGWDIDKLGFDPQFYSNQIASKMGTPRPTSAANIIRYMLKYEKLNTKPGATDAYSNFGYNILGRVIAKASGMSYEAYLKKQILGPTGINRMAIGKTKKSRTAKGEVLYYNAPFASKVTSVLASGPKQVPAPYGGFYVKSFDAHGGWIASAVDLVRFAKDAKPAPYSGDWSFNGSMWGTRSRVTRKSSGDLIMAVVFNCRPKGDKAFGDAVAQALDKGSAAVKKWPSHNLFGKAKKAKMVPGGAKRKPKKKRR